LFLMLLLVALARGAAASQAPTAAESAAIEQRLLEGVRRNPQAFDAERQLASFYLQQGKVRAALPHLERAHAIEPADVPNSYDLARALLETGKLDEARTQVRQMIAANETAELLNLLGDVEQRAGNFAAAAEPYQRAARMTPTEEHLFDWGDNLLQLRAFDDAAQVFTAAIARHPQSARLRVGLGIAEYSRGQYESAVKSLCEAADLAPSDPRPYQFLGEMYGVYPGLGDEVSSRLARFAKAHPKNAIAQFHYAMSLWKGDRAASAPVDLQRVEAMLRHAVTLDPRLAKGFLELGILLSEQQRYTEAIPQLRRAARLQPALAQAHYRLGQAYQRTGQKGLAAQELELFKRLTARATESSS
jgi:tetratricopeptide (TPR) repeat protein